MKAARRLLIVSSMNTYGMRVLSGIHTYCRTYGDWEYHVEQCRHPEVLQRIRYAIRDWKAEGIIVLVEQAKVERLIARSGLPAVNFGAYSTSKLPTVMADNAAIGRLAAQHLMNNGFRNFAFCARTTELSPRQRCEGFTAELMRNGFKCRVFSDRFVSGSERNWLRNRNRMRQWLISLPKPAGIMCSHDPRGQEVSWACRRAGFRVPDEMALVAVGDDQVLCQMCKPPLSSVDMDVQRIGFGAARLLHRLMDGKPPPVRPILAPPRGVITRQSSDIVGIDDVEVACAMRFIRDHAHKPIGVNDLLNEVSISRRSLEQRFENSIGRSPKQEIMRIRIDRVKQLLAETDLPARTIALRSGFSGPDKLSIAFRRETGQTPTAYRHVVRAEP